MNRPRTPKDTHDGTGARRRAWLCLGLAAACSPAMALPGKSVPARQVPKKPEPPPMPAELSELIRRSGLPSDGFGLHVQPATARGPVLASLNAEQPYQLASTAKVVTTLAALDLLGPQFRWRTCAFLDGPLRQGRLLGDLRIVGGGDARLSSDDLRAWFARMREQGLREVWGDIVLDRLAFRLNEADHAATPQPAPDRPHHVRPDALTLNEGVLRVSVSAGKGLKPALAMEPPLAGLRLLNRLDGKGHCAFTVQPDPAARMPTLKVSGQWSEACGLREVSLVPMAHEEYTVRAVEGLWREAGGHLKGRVLDRRGPAVEAVAAEAAADAPGPWSIHESPPLPAVLREINKSSDNLAARHLLLALSPEFPQRPATLDQARRRIAQWLRAQGLDEGDIEIDNGAGLARSERGRPRAMVQLLRNAWASSQSRTFVESLPVAGVDGTLAHRMTQGAAAGQAFLKTGTLLDTRALAGYVRCTSGRTQALALMVNHPDAARAVPAMDAIVEWVARFG